jgi:hypothetical protein
MYNMIMKYIVTFLICLILSVYPGAASKTLHADQDDMMDLSLNPMIELDFMKKEEVYALRIKYVEQFPELAPNNYKPSDAVFGQIEDGKPWFGILGISYYGAGEKSNAGPSEESRFIANPYLLIGLSDKFLIAIKNSNLKPQPIYPHPLTLSWKKDKTYAKVTYNVEEYLHLARQYYGNRKVDKELGLTYYNASDFGFNYMFIDPDLCRNVALNSPKDEPIPLVQYIHTGGQGNLHPDGVNNKSPEQKESEIEIEDLPLLLVIKLWKEKPLSVTQQADMTFEIEGR